MRDDVLSVNEKEFILKARLVARSAPAPCLTGAFFLQALQEDQRTDGRRPFESRTPKFQARRGAAARSCTAGKP